MGRLLGRSFAPCDPRRSPSRAHGPNRGTGAKPPTELPLGKPNMCLDGDGRRTTVRESGAPAGSNSTYSLRKSTTFLPNTAGCSM